MICESAIGNFSKFELLPNLAIRLLAINDQEIGSEAQSTVVSWLKALEAGEVVNLKVSRMNTVPAEESKKLVESSYEIQIGKNGLGLHLKSTKNSQNGLFIESIVKNGAAEQVKFRYRGIVTCFKNRKSQKPGDRQSCQNQASFDFE